MKQAGKATEECYFVVVQWVRGHLAHCGGQEHQVCSGQVPLVLSKHRVIRRVQDENGRRDRFTPRGSVPVILLGRLKGSLFRFLDFPYWGSQSWPIAG